MWCTNIFQSQEERPRLGFSLNGISDFRGKDGKTKGDLFKKVVIHLFSTQYRNEKDIGD